MPSVAASSRRQAPSRRRLSHAQKLELCEFSLAHRHLDKLSLAIWAANHFRLGLPPGERTIGRILAQYGELRAMTPEQLLHKSTPSEPQRRLDARLRDWIGALHAQGMRVDGAMIKHEAARVYAELQEDDGVAGSARELSFSNGWLSRFLDRNGISLRSMQPGGSPFVSGPHTKAKKAPKKNKAAPARTTNTARHTPRRSVSVASATSLETP